MTATTERDDAALADGFGRWLSREQTGRPAVVLRLARPSAGYSSDTVVLDIERDEVGAPGVERLVVRMAPLGRGTFADYDLVPQYEAQQAAALAGVPVADPVLERDPSWIGAPFLVMPFVDGHLVGPVPHVDHWLLGLAEAERGRVHAAFVDVMARIHRGDPLAAPAVPRRDDAAELAYWGDYLEWSSDGSPEPVLAAALDWCRAHRPDTCSDPVLLWGDARLENVVYGDDLALRAVLDWDMTSVGPPEHDLAWCTALDLTIFHLFGDRLAGFPDRDTTVASYEAASGRRLHDLAWYETLALLRSAAIMTRIGYLRRDAGKPVLLPVDDNPVLDLLAGRIR